MDNTQLIVKATCQHLGIDEAEGASMYMLGALPIYHTYQAWQDLGYQVQKGEKAAFAAKIWKMTTLKGKDGEEKKDKMIMKMSYFFGRDQVKPIQ